MPKTAAKFEIGQLLIVGFEGTELNPRLASMLKKVQPAGIILFARNIESAQQTYKLLRDCQACLSTPLFTCVDMEGGKVDRFRDVIGPAPSAAEVFSTGNRSLFRRHARLIGDACRSLGFNLDLAPVVDLAFPASRTVMNSRSVSDDPRKAAIYAREFLAGLKDAGVLGAVKHFPGLGEARLDTHHELPSVSKPWKQLWLQDLAPYRILRSAAKMVLVGHAAYPAVTHSKLPASLSSKWITGVLKKKIGFRGLVLSDDLEMGGVLKAAPIGKAAVEFVRAGGDLCLVCHLGERVLACHESLTEEASRNPRFAIRAQDSIKRILAFKSKSKELRRRGSSPKAPRIEQLSCQLWEFGEQVRLEAMRNQSMKARA